MGSAAVVPGLDVLHDCCPGRHVIGEVVVVVHLGLQVREERLGDRVDAQQTPTSPMDWVTLFPAHHF